MTRLLLPAEVCEVLRVRNATLKRLAAQGELVPVYIGSGRGTRRYREEDLDGYIAARTTPPKRETDVRHARAAAEILATARF